jgi:hypothetical protein
MAVLLDESGFQLLDETETGIYDEGGAAALAALTQVLCARSGGGDIAAGLTAAGGAGDTFPAGPNSFLRVKNANAAACTVTVTPSTGSGPQGTSIGALALAPPVALTSGDRVYGPFPAYPFADANGNVNVSYSVTSSVSVEALLMAT